MCKINGRMVTVNELKNFMSKFIEIHGQNDNQSLLDNKFHLKYLDGFIGEELLKYKQEYEENKQNIPEIAFVSNDIIVIESYLPKTIK